MIAPRTLVRWVALPLLTLCSSGLAQAADRFVQVADFTRLSVVGPYRVEVLNGRPAAVRMSGPVEALDRVQVIQTGRLVTIRPNRFAWAGANSARDAEIVVRVHVTALAQVGQSGPGAMTVDQMKGTALAVRADGTGSLRIDQIEADRLDLVIQGAGTVRLTAGRVLDARTTLRGPASLLGGGVKIRDLVMDAQGSGSAQLDVERSAKLLVAGAMGVDIAGRPACTIQQSGPVTIRCGSGPGRKP